MAKKTPRRRTTNGKKPRKTVPKTGPPSEGKHRWTFLTNHSHVLILLYAQPGLVLREIAGRVGITERAVQQIIHDLEDAGFVERERVGRQNHYQVRTDLPLRHPIEAHCQIADLLSLIADHPDADPTFLS